MQISNTKTIFMPLFESGWHTRSVLEGISKHFSPRSIHIATLPSEIQTLGKYVKKWVPELNKVPIKFIHKPWEMERKYQEALNTIIGSDYPMPIVIHEKARNDALSAFQSIKKKN